MFATGVPLPFSLIMVGLYTETRFGSGKRVTGDVKTSLGRLLIAFTQYVKDNVDYWLPEKVRDE